MIVRFVPYPMAYPRPIPVRFEPVGLTVMVSPGTTLLEASRRAGISLPSTCGGQCECGECIVIVVDGQLSSLTIEEEAKLSEEGLQQNWRLACCARVHSQARVQIPAQKAEFH